MNGHDQRPVPSLFLVLLPRFSFSLSRSSPHLRQKQTLVYSALRSGGAAGSYQMWLLIIAQAALRFHDVDDWRRKYNQRRYHRLPANDEASRSQLDQGPTGIRAWNIPCTPVVVQREPANPSWRAYAVIGQLTAGHSRPQHDLPHCAAECFIYIAPESRARRKTKC